MQEQYFKYVLFPLSHLYDPRDEHTHSYTIHFKPCCVSKSAIAIATDHIV